MLLATSCTACGAADGPVCGRCVERLRPVGAVDVPGLDRAWALVAYDDVGADLVRALKYGNRRSALGPLARVAAGLVDEAVDVVAWVPAEPGRRRRRGYDQGELLGRAVARRLHRPARRLLVRRGTGAQTGRGRADRLVGPDLAPAVARVPGAVLVVDDVVTTGGSLQAAARVLRAAGARRVLGLALAATPPPPTG